VLTDKSKSLISFECHSQVTIALVGISLFLQEPKTLQIRQIGDGGNVLLP
jgi:hypothetical protein